VTRTVSPKSVALARVISWIGHPLVFVTICVTIVLGSTTSVRTGWPVLLGLFLSVIAPTALLLYLGVRSGRWKDADVSVRQERRSFYHWAIPISALGLLTMWWIKAPSFVLRGGLTTFGMLILAALINRFFKISLHAIFAGYCAIILCAVGWGVGVAAVLLALASFWSRLVLRRHSVAEVIAGGLLGILGGIFAAWIPF